MEVIRHVTLIVTIGKNEYEMSGAKCRRHIQLTVVTQPPLDCIGSLRCCRALKTTSALHIAED
jgi:hypothetical protein